MAAATNGTLDKIDTNLKNSAPLPTSNPKTEPPSETNKKIDRAREELMGSTQQRKENSSKSPGILARTWTSIKKTLRSFTCCSRAHTSSQLSVESVGKQNISKNPTSKSSNSLKQKMIRKGKSLCLFLRKMCRKIASIFKRTPSAPKPIQRQKGNPIVVGSTSRNLSEVFKETKNAAKRGFTIYLNDETTESMKLNTIVFEDTQCIKITTKPFKETIIEVWNQDTLLVALNLKNTGGMNPAVLNLANGEFPLGASEDGASAQEEMLAYRTNYFESLYPEENPHLAKQLKKDGNGNPIYKIPEFGVIYSPKVQVFRNHNFKFMQPLCVDMIASAAYHMGYDHPYDRNKSSDENFETYKNNTKEKYRAILRVAKLSGHDSLVDGAAGCGVFGQEAEHVAQFKKEVLEEPEFRGQFRLIVFAILEDRKRNFTRFKDAFASTKCIPAEIPEKVDEPQKPGN